MARTPPATSRLHARPSTDPSGSEVHAIAAHATQAHFRLTLERRIEAERTRLRQVAAG